MNAANFGSGQRRYGRDAAAVRSRRDNLLANRRAGHPASPLWRLVTLAFCLALGFVFPVLAGALQISGTISDALGRPLAAVNIELRNGNGSAIARATTDQAGRFKIAPAKPGSYSLVGRESRIQVRHHNRPFSRPAPHSNLVTLEAETSLMLPVQASLIRAQNGVSTTGANKYTVTAEDVSNLPRGDNTTITDVLAQMPGVAIDQNQQIHIRNTEGPNFSTRSTALWSRSTSILTRHSSP